MKESTRQHGQNAKGENGDQPTSLKTLLRDDWEERLREARERRAIASRKGTDAAAEKTAKIPFPLAAEDEFHLPASTVPSASRTGNRDNEQPARGRVTQPSTPPVPPNTNAPPVRLVAGSQARTLPAAATPVSAPPRRVSRAVPVAFACFFGLGFGLVGGIGGMLALGWVSPNDIGSVFLAGKPTLPQPAPAVDAAGTGPFAGPAPEYAGMLVISMERPVSGDERDAPHLVRHEAGEPGFVKLSAPEARPEVQDFANEVVSRLEFDPALAGLIIAAPDGPPESPEAGPSAVGLDRDALPVLPHRQRVDTQIAVASLAMPDLADIGRQSVPTAADTPTTTRLAAFVPAMDPDLLPHVVGGAPRKLEVFDAGAPMNLPPVPAALLPQVEAGFEPLPLPPQRSEPPMVPAATFQLPSVDEQTYRGRAPLPGPDNQSVAVPGVKLIAHAPSGIGGDRLAEELDILESSGLSVDKVLRVNFKVSQTHVRYYNAEDAAAARAIAGEVGGPARDFTHVRNPPPPGLVEVWLRGNRGAVRSTGTSTRSASAAADSQTLKSRLEKSLVQRLRRGEQFRGSP